MKTLSTWNILYTVYDKYIMKIKLLKLSIGPIIVTMIIARLMEIKVTELIQKASKELGLFGNSNIYLQYLIVAISSSFLVEIQGFIFTSSVQRSYRTAIKNSITDYLKLEYKDFKKRGIGAITANIDRQSSAISEILDVFVLNLMPVIFVLILAVLKIYSTLGALSSIIVSVALVSYTAITIKMAVWRNEIRKGLNLSVNESKDKLMDILINYDSIVAFNNQRYEIERYDEKLAQNEVFYVQLWRTFYLLNFLQKFVFCLKTGLIIYVGLKNQMTSDGFVLYLSISRVLGVNLDKLGYMYSRFTSAIINAKMGFLSIDEPKQLYPLRYFENSIRFKNVGINLNNKSDFDFFNYENEGQFIFNKLNCEIKKGEKIALVGFNGVGKSNFLKILLKFNQYTGSIRIDNDELFSLSNNSIREMISYVPQESFLISGTVKENMLYGNPMISEEEMIELCRYLGFDESFRKLSAGYETFIGKNNSILSGGEKQKIAIVRSLLKPSEIYLFDEPTASLDRKSEDLFFSYLNEYEKEKTAIVVIHNLDLLDRFDRILFLTKDGIHDVTQSEATSLIDQKKQEELSQ